MPAGDFPFAIEQAFLAAIETRWPGVFKKRLDHEPQKLEQPRHLPAVTMLAWSPRDRDHQTGPATEVTWRWTVRLYVSLRSGWKEAQRELRELTPKLLVVIRSDPSLAGSTSRADLQGDDAEPEISTDEQVMWASFVLTAQTEETS